MTAEEFYKEYFGYNPTEDQVLEIEFAEAYAKQLLREKTTELENENEAIKRVSKKEILALQRENQALKKQGAANKLAVEELKGYTNHRPPCETVRFAGYQGKSKLKCTCGLKQALRQESDTVKE